MQASGFYKNEKCPYFPCHAGVSENDFNCLFCYCPLYALGEECGGNFSYTIDGFKDCSACVLPHIKDEGNKLVEAYYPRIMNLAARKK